MYGFQLVQTYAFKCPVCHQYMSSERQIATGQIARLVGYAKYAVCPNCRQEVKPPWSKAYKRRWKKYVIKQSEKGSSSVQENPRKTKTSDEWSKYLGIKVYASGSNRRLQAHFHADISENELMQVVEKIRAKGEERIRIGIGWNCSFHNPRFWVVLTFGPAVRHPMKDYEMIDKLRMAYMMSIHRWKLSRENS